MKKYIWVLVLSILLVGCRSLSNVPTAKVEELLNKYQTLDEQIVNELNASLIDTNYTDEQKEKYKDIMKKQYNNLTYQIKEYKIDGNKATVTATITVKDFYRVLKDADVYYEANREEFLENGNYISKFNDYRLELLEKAKEKVSYTIDFELTKENEWKVNTLSNEIIDKISGVYAY